MEKRFKNFKKLKIGVDFDNTIVDYQIPLKILLRRNNIKTKISNKKQAKKLIIKKFGEKFWTLQQGLLYGKLIQNAKPFTNCKKTLSLLKKDFELILISHKTKFPYLGEKFPLHEKSLQWLKNKKFIGNNNIFKFKDVYFETTINKKINRIKKAKCDIFIDDLESILKLIPDKLFKIKYGSKSSYYKYSLKWENIPKIINEEF
tara:strand:- start:332 stop:940 length:609 start_codon:yes stop_codon:yes gene_type:complete